MTKEKRDSGFIKGAAILAFAAFLTKVVGLIYRLPLTSILGDEGNGLYADAFQVYTVLITLSAYGLPTAISKLVAERSAKGAHKEAHRVFQTALVYSGVFGGILSSLMWFFASDIANLMGSPRSAGAMKALAPTLLVVVLMSSFRGYFQGLNTMFPTALSQVVEQLFNAGFSILLAYILISRSLESAVVGSTLGTGIGALSGFVIILILYGLVKPNINKRIKRSVRVPGYKEESRKELLKQILITTIPILLGTAIFSITSTIDLKMINDMLPNVIDKLLINGQKEYIAISNLQGLDAGQIVNMLKGQYAVKYLTFINVPLSLIISLATVSTPAISYAMASKNFNDVREKTNLVMKIGMLLAFPAFVGMATLANPIIHVLFRSQPDGGALLQLGSLAIVFITIAQISTGILQGLGKQQLPTIHSLFACGIKILLNMILLQIPQINIYGIIYSTIICYMVFAFLNLRSVISLTGVKFDILNVFIKPGLISAFMGLVTLLGYFLLASITSSSLIYLTVLIPLAIVIYFFGLIGAKAISRKELEILPGGHKIIKFLKKIGLSI